MAPQKTTKRRPNKGRRSNRRPRTPPRPRQRLNASAKTGYGVVRKALPSTYSKLALAMALPRDHPNLRFPSVDAPRTSVCTLLDQFTQVTPTSGTAFADFASSDLLFMFFGQPARTLMRYGPGPGSAGNGLYDCLFYNDSNPTNTGSIGESFNWTLTSVGIASGNTGGAVGYWPLSCIGWNSGTLSRGGLDYVGMSNDVPFLFMNIGDTLSTVLTAWTSTAVFSVAFNVVEWTGDGSPSTASSLQIGSVGNQIPAQTFFTCTQAGYFAIYFDGINVGSGGITSAINTVRIRLNTATASNYWQNTYCSDVESNNGGDSTMLTKSRVNAAALLVTNTTAIIGKAGTVVAARIKVDNPFYITTANLKRAAEKYTGQAEHGVYTFKEFTSECEAFADSCGPAIRPTFSLDVTDFFHFIQISCGPSNQNTFLVSIDTSLEFCSDTARYAKGVSMLNHNDLILARRHINSNPVWFYENPLHMQDIYNFLKSVGNKTGRMVQKVAPYGAAMASMAHPAGAPAYSALNKALQMLTFGNSH